MAQNSKIEWTDHTVNLWWGCEFATYANGDLREECFHCYAKKLAAAFSKGKATWGKDGKRWMRIRDALAELAALDNNARKRGVRERVFINSMSDIFEGRIDLDEARCEFFAFAETLTNLDLLLLTKRPGNVVEYVPEGWLTNWPAFIWIGATVGTQRAADEVIPELLEIPAKVRFLSCEPLLEKLDLDYYLAEPLVPQIHWVICGGESGPNARPMHPDWARSLRDQCQAAGVPFFFKQWGEWGLPTPIDKCDCNAKSQRIHLCDDSNDVMHRVGKKSAGRLLDGREWNEFPC